jgi:hypothetical protein
MLLKSELIENGIPAFLKQVKINYVEGRVS